eukprot:jgi/Hompol1/4492/HPOL_000554-RA
MDNSKNASAISVVAVDVYGIENEVTELNQELGSVEAMQGRCIVFPNTWQHKVQPFRLADPTQPGHRKILVFFLVDPTRRIVSTAHMAPQQPDWYDAEVGSLGKLPPELWSMITKHVAGTMSLEEAKQYRLELMKERSAVSKTVTEEMFEQVFNL